MEDKWTTKIRHQTADFEFNEHFNYQRERETQLDELLDLTSLNFCEKALIQSSDESAKAVLFKKPMSTRTVFAQFGLMLGTFPPMALFGKFIYKSNLNLEDYWVVGLLILVNFVCAAVGYFSGKLIGRIVAETEKWSWVGMLLTLPFIGILWGVLSGGAGGLFLFIIGAIFGAFFAGIIGGVALPVFTILHRLLKNGDQIERNQFLPIGLGISLIFAAIILGTSIK